MLLLHEDCCSVGILRARELQRTLATPERLRARACTRTSASTEVAAPPFGTAMGCGASKASSAIAGVEDVEQQRDPEDYILDPIQLQVTKIEEFDEVFTHLGTLLNRLIELNNNVHLAVGAVKAAYAPLAGGFELLVSLAPSTDVVLLDIHASRVNTSRPAPETLQRLVLSQPAVKEAAAELEAARTQLHDFLAESEDRIGLLVGKDGGIALEEHGEVPQQVQHFNTCMAKLQGLLSTHGHLTASVKPTASHGTKTIRAQLYRRSPGEVEADLKPVSVVDVCTSQQGARIKQAEAFLADRAQHLAQRIKGMDLEWEVVSGYFLVLMSELPNPDVQQHVGKLLQAINIALFKLLNAGASAATPASLTHAVLELVRPVCTALQNRHDNLLAYNLKTLISVNPTVVFTKEGEGVPPCFEFNLNVELKEQAGIDPFPDCLPEQPALLLGSMEHLIAHVAGALTELPAISEDVDMLLEQAKEFYDLCPEAAARRGLSMMEAVKCSKATGSNLRLLCNTQDLFLAFGENVKRVADELGGSSGAVQKLIDSLLVGSTTE